MQPALSQVCSLNSPFETDVKDYSAGGCTAIEVWLTKLETYLAARSLDDARRLLDKHGVTLPVASYQGGLLTSQGEARRLAWELFNGRLELCRSLGIGTLVVACDVAGPLTQQDLDRVRVSLHQAAQEAARFNVRVALEFQAGAAFGNNLLSAAALVAEVDSPQLGLCLDAFHFYVGPSQTEDLNCIDIGRIFHVQVCDLADVPRELATDSHRILPGEGDIPLPPLLGHLSAAGYREHVSVELMNPLLWQIPPRQFSEAALGALKRLLDTTRSVDQYDGLPRPSK